MVLKNKHKYKKLQNNIFKILKKEVTKNIKQKKKKKKNNIKK
jgi:hypothetical protein